MKKNDKETISEDQSSKPVCGIVMPISTMEGYPDTHWSDVREILEEAILEAGFEPNLVSNADDVGIIQQRIIQNLYDNPIVVCDVSGKNPNVMFELGLRLAFDKPTIIIKDDKTSYTFDTSPIEHLGYPRDLRFAQIVEFKDTLADKIQATHHRATTDETYTTFLKHFGEFTVAKLDKKEVPTQQFILEQLKTIQSTIQALGQRPITARPFVRTRPLIVGDVNLCARRVSDEEIVELEKIARTLTGFKEFSVEVRAPDHKHLIANFEPGEKVQLRDYARQLRKIIGSRLPIRIRSEDDKVENF